MAESSKAPLLPVLHNINPSIPRAASHLRCSVPSARTIYVAMGPAASAVILSALDMSDHGASKSMLAALAWVFIWWLTEAVPVPVTSMAPLYLFPLFGITSAEDVAKSYMNDVIALVLGSFILAIAVEHYKIHQRLALNITLLFCGDPPNPSLILLGICGTTTFISFWMHNTAAAVMMVPVATGLLQRFPNDGEEGANRNVIGFCKAVVLGVIYSASIGGIATLTGTGVNLITAGMWASYFPHERPISFSSWSMFALPLAVVMFLALWGILCFLYLSRNTGQALAIYFDKDHLKRELQLLGPMALAEKMVLSVFSFLVVLWMTRSITDQIPGWESLFKLQIGDGTVSVLMATVLFVLPNMKGEGEKILDWNKCRKLQWNVILLLGAGFAIADGVRVSGLSDLLSDGLVFLRNVPPLAVAPLVCLLTATMTEFASNNATATLVAPLLIQLANTIGMHPLLLVLPGAIGAEFAFWLPTGTPPNAVGFATGRISIVDMLKVGVPLKFFGVAALGVLMPTLGTAVFGISK